jgi:hypothetical protein
VSAHARSHDIHIPVSWFAIVNRRRSKKEEFDPSFPGPSWSAMFRRTPSKLQVSTYARFLMDSKGKHSGVPAHQRAKIMTTEYNAVKRDTKAFEMLQARARSTPKPPPRVRKARNATTYANFVRAVYAKKIFPSGKVSSVSARRIALLWKKYKTACSSGSLDSAVLHKIMAKSPPVQ